MQKVREVGSGRTVARGNEVAALEFLVTLFNSVNTQLINSSACSLTVNKGFYHRCVHIMGSGLLLELENDVSRPCFSRSCGIDQCTISSFFLTHAYI